MSNGCGNPSAAQPGRGHPPDERNPQGVFGFMTIVILPLCLIFLLIKSPNLNLLLILYPRLSIEGRKIR